MAKDKRKKEIEYKQRVKELKQVRTYYIAVYYNKRDKYLRDSELVSSYGLQLNLVLKHHSYYCVV